jgi:hypothetical protein
MHDTYTYKHPDGTVERCTQRTYYRRLADGPPARPPGRPQALDDEDFTTVFKALDGRAVDISRATGLGLTTVYRYISRLGLAVPRSGE